jgi:hypothetical protein
VALRRERTKVPIPHLGSVGEVSTNRRDFFVQSDNVSGRVVVPMAYDDSTVLLMRHLLGRNTTGGSNPYDHAVDLFSPISVPLTLEQIPGSPAAGGGNMAELFDSCVINGGVVSVTAGDAENGVMMLDLDIIGRTSGGLAAAGTPTYNETAEYILHNHAGSISYDSVTVAMQSMTITVNRGFSRNNELGSLYTQVPVEDRVSATLETTVFWQNETLYDKYLDDTLDRFEITFTGATSPNRLIIASNFALVTDRSAPVQAAGGIVETVRYDLLASQDLTDSDGGLTFTFRNDNTLHSAN